MNKWQAQSRCPLPEDPGKDTTKYANSTADAVDGTKDIPKVPLTLEAYYRTENTDKNTRIGSHTPTNSPIKEIQ